MLNLDGLTYKIRLDDSEVAPAAVRTERAVTRLGSSAAVGQNQFNGLSNSTKLTRQEVLALNYTMSDVAASLASGASPWTILAQQGGQVKDAFGGVGPLFSKLGSLFTVGRVAIGGVAAAAGALFLAFQQGSAESKAFETGMARTGNQAGITEAQFRDLYQQIAQGSGATVGASKDVLQALIDTGQFGPKALGAVGLAAAAMTRAFDLSADDVAKDFARMGDSAAHWAADHNKTMNFLTVEQYKYIRSLEETGRVSEAQAYAAKLVEEAASRVTRNLGTLESAWKGVKDWASQAWNAMLGIGRADTTADKLAALQKRIEDIQKGPFAGTAKGDQRIQELRQQIRALDQADQFKRQALDSDAARAIENRKAIEDARKEENKKGGAGKKPKVVIDKAYLEAFKAEQEITAEQDKATQKFYADQQAKIDKEQADYRQRLEQGADFGAQLAEQAQAINVSLITDDEQRARAQLAIEKDAVEKRIRALGLLPEAEAALLGRAAALTQARERQITEQLKPEYQKRLEQYQDLNSYMKRAADEFNTGWLDSGKQAFSQWVTTGKFSASTLVDFIVRKFAEMTFERYLAAPFASLGNAIFGAFGSFGGGGGGDWFGSVMASIGLKGFAAGGNVSPWSMQRVNERGPELLTVGGSDYLMMGGQGGRVTPAGKTAQRLGGDTYITVAPVFHGGVSRNELATGMAAATDMAVGAIRDQRRRGDRTLVRD